MKTNSPLFNMICKITSLFTLSLGLSTHMQAESNPSRINNIVLVHGAFSDGSSWTEVIKILQKKGYNVTAVQNPLTSLEDDVLATKRVLKRQKGDVLLVGHSWGGAVISEAGNETNVKGIVYISALAPNSNESVVDLLTRMHAPMEGLNPDNEGFIWLDEPTVYKKVMAADLSIKEVAQLAALQQPISVKAFMGKISNAAWQSKPSWYLITDGDNALPTVIQQKIAENIKAHTTTIQSSHMSLKSHSHDVVKIIEEAAVNIK